MKRKPIMSRNNRFITIDQVQGTALFQDVPRDALQSLLERCEERHLDLGAILLRPDVLNDEMYLILRGKVSIHLESVESPPLLTLGSGECIGEMSLFDGKPPSAYVQVVEPSVMLVINRTLLWEIIDACHGVARNLLLMLSHRLRTSNIAMREVQEQNHRHESEATHDALTGLYNRRWLDTFLAQVKDQMIISALPLSFVMVDVDHFKHLNDQYGHEAGDRVLKELAHLLRQNVRPDDMIARFGGEEFIILLPSTSRASAVRLAERLRQRVAAQRVTLDDQALLSVTISAGIAECRDVNRLEEGMRQSDAALYRAKRAGRNRIFE